MCPWLAKSLQIVEWQYLVLPIPCENMIGLYDSNLAILPLYITFYEFSKICFEEPAKLNYDCKFFRY